MVTNRQDCCASRLHNLQITVGDNPLTAIPSGINVANYTGNPICFNSPSGVGLTGASYAFQCVDPVTKAPVLLTGRYVTIQILD